MKKIKLTNKNIQMVTGQLRRFFFNSKYGFTSHHNFDCGYKNIKPYGRIELNTSVDAIEIAEDILSGDKFIRITFQRGVSATVLHLGSYIIFKGGFEIITQEKWKGTKDLNYLYNVYRLKPLSYREELLILEQRKWDKEMSDSYWKDVEREYEEDYEYEELAQ